jgi:hypothetical protein
MTREPVLKSPKRAGARGSRDISPLRGLMCGFDAAPGCFPTFCSAIRTRRSGTVAAHARPGTRPHPRGPRPPATRPLPARPTPARRPRGPRPPATRPPPARPPPARPTPAPPPQPPPRHSPSRGVLPRRCPYPADRSADAAGAARPRCHQPGARRYNDQSRPPLQAEPPQEERPAPRSRLRTSGSRHEPPVAGSWRAPWPPECWCCTE